MNERIRNIAVAADVWCDRYYSGQDSYDTEWEQKFAQLIVEECAEFANEHNEEIEGVTLGVGSALKKHFGVEL